VTVGDKTGNLPSDQVVTGKEKEDTNLVVNQPTKTEVEDPAHLTDAEKSAVEEAVRQANPDLPSDAVITVSDNGEVTVTVGDKTGTLPSDQVVTGKVEEGTNLEVNQPAKTEVEDPAHLTDAEKSAVEEAVRQANPDLPSDATIEVSDNGEVTVTAGDKTGNLPSDQVVTGKVEEDTNLEVNQPAKTEVQDPSHLTDAEKSAVEEAVRQANPDLPSDATIEVSDNGEVTVTVGDKTGTISPANTVEQAGMTVDKSALETEQGKETSVKESDAYKKADPVKQAAYDKALEEASNILADPNATQAQVDQALKVLEEARADLNGQASESGKLNLPAVTTVTDPAHLTPAEQAAIKEAIRQANPNLADAMIVVHPNGSATVTIDGQEITLTADQLVVRRAADAGQAANTDASKPATDATQASQASIKQVAQDPAVTTGQASQVAESQTTSQDSQASDLPATGETTSYGALGAAILSILSGIGLIAPRKKEEE
ncbi:LPXTG cell wall anchor domain-containing protein, partial [Hutsoniella sourekii]|uniref:LPXTG cell wall anchor domain-containing protein n=1 Tax=Hutsoniella sourekii TaxID=87650 RepID=UPI00054D8AD8